MHVPLDSRAEHSKTHLQGGLEEVLAPSLLPWWLQRLSSLRHPQRGVIEVTPICALCSRSHGRGCSHSGLGQGFSFKESSLPLLPLGSKLVTPPCLSQSWSFQG